MRIAFLTDTFLPQINGIVTSIVHFSEELGRRGHEVLILAPRPRTPRRSLFRAEPRGSGQAGAPAWSAPNVRVQYLRSLPSLLYPEYRLSFLGRRTVLRALKAFDPHVIHFHTPLTVGRYAIHAARTLGKPLVGTNHIYLTKDNAVFLRCIVGNRPRFQRNIAPAVRRYSASFYRTCEVCCVPSRTLATELARGKRGFASEHLPNGIDCTKVRRLAGNERQQMKERWGLSEHVVLHVGRLSKEKGVEAVVRAFALVRDSNPDTSLLLIGDGPAKASLKKLAEKLGMGGNVVFTGAIPHEELLTSGILSVGDVFVTASRMESQGMVLLEAMAAGLPVVCVQDAAVEEMVQNVGTLVPPEDVPALAAATKVILDNASLAEEMSRASLAQAQCFSVAVLVDRLLGIYEEAGRRKNRGK